MHILLTKLLNKRGLKREELSQEEKTWFDEKQKILSGEEITIERVETFCKAQLGLIEDQFRNFENENRKNERLIVAHSIYSSLLKAIHAPKVERAQLEEYLNKLIDAT